MTHRNEGSKIRLVAKVLFVLLVLGPWSPGEASTAMYSFDSPNFYGHGYYLPQTLGNVFTPTTNIAITSLGFFDYRDDGLGEIHQVGIFDNSGTLLASAFIPSGKEGNLVDHFRYADITPITLTAGQTYTVAALLLSSADVIGYADIGKIATDSAVSLPNFSARYVLPGVNEMMYPTDTVLASAPFYIGPNFQFIVDQALVDPAAPQDTFRTFAGDIPFSSGDAPISNSTVPLPGAIWLLSSGLLGLIGLRGRFFN
jgi:hypothetical protein